MTALLANSAAPVLAHMARTRCLYLDQSGLLWACVQPQPGDADDAVIAPDAPIIADYLAYLAALEHTYAIPHVPGQHVLVPRCPWYAPGQDAGAAPASCPWDSYGTLVPGQILTCPRWSCSTYLVGSHYGDAWCVKCGSRWRFGPRVQ